MQWQFDPETVVIVPVTALGDTFALDVMPSFTS
jgi:hypothetical protein